MFKVGDKVKIDNAISYGTSYYDIVYTVTSSRLSHTNVVDDKNINFCFPSWFFKLVESKQKPISEVDFLNCFQENFKEGG